MAGDLVGYRLVCVLTDEIPRNCCKQLCYPILVNCVGIRCRIHASNSRISVIGMHYCKVNNDSPQNILTFEYLSLVDSKT